MKIIEQEQNTPAWKIWRGKGLGASDSPIIMNDSPWTSRFELWCFKTDLMKPAEPDSYAAAAMKRGHDLEPIARAAYEKETGLVMTPIACEHDTYPFIRASLDGWNHDLKRILEIKCPSKKDHETAVKGRVPTKYIPQLQHQFLVTGAESCDYFSFDGEKGVIVPVQADAEYQKKLLAELIAFWQLVESKVAPEVTPKEVCKVLKEAVRQMSKLNGICAAMKILTEIM